MTNRAEISLGRGGDLVDVNVFNGPGPLALLDTELVPRTPRGVRKGGTLLKASELRLLGPWNRRRYRDKRSHHRRNKHANQPHLYKLLVTALVLALTIARNQHTQYGLKPT